MGGKYKGSWSSVLLLVTTIVLLAACSPGSAQQYFDHIGPFVTPAGDCPYVPNEVIVTMRSGATETELANLNRTLGSTTVRKSKYFQNLYVLRLPGTGTTPGQTPVDQYLADIRSKPGVGAAQRNYKYYPMDQPNDPLWKNSIYWLDQWAFQTESGVSDHIFAEQAWDIEKGKDDVVVAVIDTGVRTYAKYDDNDPPNIIRYPHPDLGGYKRSTTALTGIYPRVYPNVYTYDGANTRLLYGVDVVLEDNDGVPDPSPSESIDDDVIVVAPHATHVSGIIAAKTNNSAGVAGLCWENVWILPIKVFNDDNWYATDVDVADGIMYCISYNVDVINLSLGSQYPSALEQSAIRQAVRSGIVVVGAAGNSWGGAAPPVYPGAYDEVICVGATGTDDKVSYFSQRGHAVDIAAPGEYILSTYWAMYNVDEDAIDDYYDLPDDPSVTVTIQPGATDIWGNGYAYESGTSMAAPIVSAAAALLRSLDVPAEDVRGILTETATPVGIGRPNDAYGWGLLNLEAALKKACIEVDIQAPSAGTLVNSKRPRFRIDFRRAEKDSIKVWIDDNLIMNGTDADFDQYYYTLNEAAGKTYLLFEYTLTENAHTIRVSAESGMTLDDPPPDFPFTDDDSVDFRIQSSELAHGWHLFSVPYSLMDVSEDDRTPEELLGPNGILARWNYANSATGSYAMYSLDGSWTDDEATFIPPSVIIDSDDPPAMPGEPAAMPLVYSLGSAEAGSPAGLGYWLYITNPDGIDLPEVVGESMESESYVISLYKGWNMVGDPFAFPVNWASVVVEYGGVRVPATEAVAKGWLANWVYRYDNTYSKYTWQTISSAQMIPWEAQWIKVKVNGPDGWPEPDVKLIVPPSAYTGVLQ